MTIERAFVRIREGQVHYRRTAEANGGRPLVALHMSPVASGFLMPLLGALDDGRRPLIAPDTMGNGDSCPLALERPEIADFAEALGRVLDALGVGEIDLYGVRTGAMIATELAIASPARVRRLVVDEIVVPGPMQRTGVGGPPCPLPDDIGSPLDWAFHVMRDHWTFYPWWAREGTFRRPWDLPSPAVLHDQTVEVLKAVHTFRHSYDAAQRWPRSDRLALIRVPTMVLRQPDPSFYPDTGPIAALIPGAVARDLPPRDMSQAAKAALIKAWLDEG